MDNELQNLINQKVDIKYNLSDEHVFILGAHINTLEKEKLLVKCIKKLREFNIPIILSTHYKIKTEIVELADYFINDDKNELLTFDRFNEFNIDSLRWVQSRNYVVNSYVSFHHDFSAITIIKNGVLLAKELGKKKIHYFDYDCIIDTNQYYQTFLTESQIHDVVFGFLFSMNIDIAENIFIKDITTLEDHFSRSDWRFEDFLINGIKKYSNNYKASDYIDINKSLNTQAAWNRAGINRNGAFFQIYSCVDNEDYLYLSLISSTKGTHTPTSGLIYQNTKSNQDYLLEIKYTNFNKFHNLGLGVYDLVKIGKYNQNDRIKINYMGINVYDELLSKDIEEYRKMNFIRFN